VAVELFHFMYILAASMSTCIYSRNLSTPTLTYTSPSLLLIFSIVMRRHSRMHAMWFGVLPDSRLDLGEPQPAKGLVGARLSSLANLIFTSPLFIC